MATLTNHYQNCELLNLGYGPGGRGPFVVRQEGYPAGSATFQADRYLLRKDGTWVLHLCVFVLNEAQQKDYLFDTSAEALTLLDSLSGDPKIESTFPEGKTVDQLKAAAQTTLTGIGAKIRDAKGSAFTR